MRWTLPLLLVAVTLPGGCERRTARPEARLPGNGKLSITSEPGGAVVIEDGERLGRTPLTIERRAMTRPALEIVKEGHRTERVRRLVEEGRTIRVHVVIRPDLGTLIVRSGIIRGARILIDGAERGNTPRRVDVPAGRRHVIEVQRFGFQPYRSEVTVSAGETREIETELVPVGKHRGPSGWLTVRSDLPATVQLDGSPLGNTPIERVRLPAKSYRLTLTNPTLRLSRSLGVQVQRGRTREISVKLRP